jgi:GNAT superfamily N-acetyltransferase
MLRAAARGSACCDLGGEKYVMTTLSVRQAQADEAAVVSGVLSEADAWLRTRGQPLWEPAQLMTSELRAEVEAGKYIVCSEGDIVVGVARLTEDDLTFWPDAVEGEAFYVRRLAVRRTHAGKGVSLALLDWSGKRAAAAGRRWLRLDCGATRTRLRTFYERCGFVLHSERVVGPHEVARYERTATR